MQYKEMTVWSAGEKCRSKKVEFIMGHIIVILWISLCITFFTQNFNDDKTVPVGLVYHLGLGLCMSILTSVFGIGGYALTSLALASIKRNKEIKIYLYKFEDFLKLGKVPDDKTVVYSDTGGFVLCDTVNYAEYSDWQGISDNNLYFFKFEEFYEKYKGSKAEVVLS